MKYSHAALLAVASQALAAPRTSAPPGCSTVSPTGAGDFTTIQAAVDSVVPGGCIFLDQGEYPEMVLLNNTADVTMYGYTSDDAGYAGNGANIYANGSQNTFPNNDATGTLRIWSSGFKLYNVNVTNIRGAGSQAIALSAQNSSAYYGCSLKGYQDTLLTNRGKQLYANTEIVGVTDFIFGQRSYAWFENVDLRVLEIFNRTKTSTGWITANGALAQGDSKYVFNNCDIAAASGQQPVNGSYYLGRPWRTNADVVFQNTSMSAVINQTGWATWSKSNASDYRVENVTFAEFGNYGEGAVGPRANFSKILTAPIDIESILGSNYTTASWFDAAYM